MRRRQVQGRAARRAPVGIGRRRCHRSRKLDALLASSCGLARGRGEGEEEARGRQPLASPRWTGTTGATRGRELCPLLEEKFLSLRGGSRSEVKVYIGPAFPVNLGLLVAVARGPCHV